MFSQNVVRVKVCEVAFKSACRPVEVFKVWRCGPPLDKSRQTAPQDYNNICVGPPWSGCETAVYEYYLLAHDYKWQIPCIISHLKHHLITHETVNMDNSP